MHRLRGDALEAAVGDFHRPACLLECRHVRPQRGAECIAQRDRAAVLVLLGEFSGQQVQLLARELAKVVATLGRAPDQLFQLVAGRIAAPCDCRRERIHLRLVLSGRVVDERKGGVHEPALRFDHRAERGEEHLEKRGELRMQDRERWLQEGLDGVVAQRLDRHVALDVGEAGLELREDVLGRAEEVGVERRALRDMVPLRLRERVGRLVDLAADGRHLAAGELALLSRGKVVDATGKRRERDAEVGRDLRRVVHLHRLRRQERRERLAEALDIRRVIECLLRHVGEIAEERLDLRGAAVVPEHRLVEGGLHGGRRVFRKLVDRLHELLGKSCQSVESGLDRLACRVASVPFETAVPVLCHRGGDLAARKLADCLERRLRLRGGLVDRFARRPGKPGGRRLERLGVNGLHDRLRRLEEHRVQLGGDAVRLVEPRVRDRRPVFSDAVDVQRAERVSARLEVFNLRQFDWQRPVAAADHAESPVSAHGYLVSLASLMP